jgi:uncharacterized protein (TIGR03067 family)
MRRFALVLLLASGCAPAPVPDAEALLGEWAVVDFRAPGGSEDRAQFRNRARVTAETWSQVFTDGRYEDFEYALDPAREPKHLDLTFTDATGKRLTVRAIYELTGDELRVCLGSPPVVPGAGGPRYANSTRPTAFAPGPGALVVYRRARK